MFKLDHEHINALDNATRDLTSSIDRSMSNIYNSLTEYALSIEQLRSRYEAGSGGLEIQEENAKKCEQAFERIDTAFKNVITGHIRASDLNKAIDSSNKYAHNERRTMQLTRIDDLSDPNCRAPTSLDVYFSECLKRIQQRNESAPLLNRVMANPQIKNQYMMFRKNVHDIAHEDLDELPDIETFFANGEDDDLVVERAAVSYKCPLTKTWLEDPVKSSVCGHAFSKVSICDVIKRQTREYGGSTIKCPVGACSSHFGMRDLIRAPELAAKAEAQRKREERMTQAAQSNLDQL